MGASKKQPNGIAVVCDNNKITYKELSNRKLYLAKYLQFLGVSADDCVGIFVEPSLDLIIGAWGILASGGAYLPLSPEYPKDRLRYMIEDSGINFIVTQDELKNKLLELTPRKTHIITFSDVNKFNNLDQEFHYVEPKIGFHYRNLAYVIYTSGSTGKPKGVMIEHGSIMNQMHWLQNEFNLNSQSIVLQKTPMSFDAAQWEILALVCGCQIVMGSPGVYKNPEKLIKTIIKHKVTVLQCVPTLLQALLDTDEFHHCQTLTHLFIGGEVLTKHIVVECLKQLPECKLINLYGPTESTINTSAFIIDPKAVKNSPDTISIGSPIYNTQYYILDNCEAPVAVGEIGELYIGGEGLARGYLHRPELTAERFIDNLFSLNGKASKLYRTGDLAFWNKNGTVQYAGRVDNQVKLRGFRIELDEIKTGIEANDWVKNSAVILKQDQHTGYQNLIAFIELNSKEATLMDQGNHDMHHQSKESRSQVKLQLSNKGCREGHDPDEKSCIELFGIMPTTKQTKLIYSRKTYRFFEGEAITKGNILALLKDDDSQINYTELEKLSYADFGEILRYFGQYHSEERLLPKYGYASPGALYATQMYLELAGVGELAPGFYYYHPVHHKLIKIKDKDKDKKSSSQSEIKIHFVGKKSAIEPIYKNNILEVLEIETGHMVGLFEKILPEYGLSIQDGEYIESVRLNLDVAEEDYYLGSFQLVSGHVKKMDDQVDVYIQSNSGKKIADLAVGTYHYRDGAMVKISDEVILKKQTIAINQAVYARSSIGISVISRTDKDWMGYINLGRKLQSLQMNDLNIGFMSSGYSSKTGNDLPSAKRIRRIIDKEIGPSYFFIGGRISNEQKLSKGMQEDSVHMKGPAEMIKDDLVNFLPKYMIPNKVVILGNLPLMVNGKINFNKLRNHNVDLGPREYIAPRTKIEQKVCDLWEIEIKRLGISMRDNFFDLGGNSLIAVSLINKINKALNASLPLQVLFEAPTIEKLAQKISNENREASSRLVPLQSEGSGMPIYCWPGLGGYCMNLRLLASKMGSAQPFYGIQAYGINERESPYPTIKQMAAEDVKMIKRLQAEGPYTLWGYSFGARVAFEAAYQLERSGEVVENLFLIAPGSPKVRSKITLNNNQPTYNNKTYLTILFSVFMGSITGSALDECLRTVKDEDSFVKFITTQNPLLEPSLAKRIIKIVSQTFEFKYTFNELKERQINAPITVIKAKGDDYSFLENSNRFALTLPTILELDANHYSMLKDPDVDALVQALTAIESEARMAFPIDGAVSRYVGMSDSE